MTYKPSSLHILLVEDEPNFGSVLKDYLHLNGYEVSWEFNGVAGLEKFTNDKFDLCILDVMMPKIDGFTLGREIRKMDKHIPFIYLTAKTLRDDIIEGFQVGADDYIVKPFDAELLLLKIKAIMNRMYSSGEVYSLPDEIAIGRYIFKHKLRALVIDGEERNLSPREAELLKLLCKYIGTLMPRSEALTAIWGVDNYFTTRSMDVFIARVRKYLKGDPNVSIENLHGHGYVLKVDAADKG